MVAVTDPTSLRARRRPTEPERLSNGCPDAGVLERIAEALETGNAKAQENVDALRSMNAELAKVVPLAEGVAELNGRLTKLCNVIVGHRLKIVAAIIALVSTPGLLAPELVAGLKAAVAAFGG